MFTSDNPIAQTAELLEQARTYSEGLLEGNTSVILMVSSGLTQVINRLNFMAGRESQVNKPVEHPPITNFMGEEIKYATRIQKADLTPAEADREAFIKKVEQLYAQFETISPAGLLHSYTLPEDQLVIRGVAKRAGVEDYADRDIDIEFLEDIAEAIKQQAADSAKQAEIEQRLKEGTITGATPPEEEDDDDEEEEDEIPASDPKQQAADSAKQAPPTTGIGRKNRNR